MAVLQSAFDLLSTSFIIPAVNSKSLQPYLAVLILMSAAFFTAYANKGIPIPIVEGISFVDSGIQFGMVLHFVDIK